MNIMNVVCSGVFFLALLTSIVFLNSIIQFAANVYAKKNARIRASHVVIPSLFWAIFYYLTH